ncbi:hypothetical protein BDV96DRAFT_327808 [Lophiotrema nucula]|uniref:Uncharacterized protein n=1 Tax=Lophiotrema nucula TaxID=690887 RepID=A0A6A5YIT0_9PLEO|nr:hypothetical protein BDV96DRAFT_327808 [Lophiotrema nucula]
MQLAVPKTPHSSPSFVSRCLLPLGFSSLDRLWCCVARRSTQANVFAERTLPWPKLIHWGQRLTGVQRHAGPSRHADDDSNWVARFRPLTSPGPCRLCWQPRLILPAIKRPNQALDVTRPHRMSGQRGGHVFGRHTILLTEAIAGVRLSMTAHCW